MPLRDHFSPPLSKSYAWDKLHGQWPAMMVLQLSRDRLLFEAWHRPLQDGQPLPPLPLWLADDLAVTLDLEGTYEQTCEVLRIE